MTATTEEKYKLLVEQARALIEGEMIGLLIQLIYLLFCLIR